MDARSPEDLDRLFCEALNAGDLEGLVGLYEADAVLRPERGKPVAGTASIREALAAFVAMKPTIRMNTKVLALTGDIALLTNHWALSATDADGGAMKMSNYSVEVARRQTDGHWRFVADAPWGLEWDV